MWGEIIMRLLDKFEKQIYTVFMNTIEWIELDCWNHKAPKGFDKA